MNLNEECLLHYLGHFKNVLQAPRPIPAAQRAVEASEPGRAKAETPGEQGVFQKTF